MSATIRFDNRVAIVTGAGKGLGRAYARLLAERGASVIVNNRKHAGDTNQASADKVVAEIIADGGVASSNYEQVEQATAGARLLEQALDEYGRIDILINNAGIAPGGYFTKMSAAEFEQTLAINTYGSINLVRAILPAMQRAQYGKILLSLSSAGFYGNAGLSAYSASKGALYAFMQSICQEEASEQVCINAIGAGLDLSRNKDLTPELIEAHFNEIISDDSGCSFASATEAFEDIVEKLS